MNYPMIFKSTSSSPSGIQNNWECQANDFSATLAIPPEFTGPGGGASPEDLFCLALSNCFLATFKVYAENSRLNFKRVEVESSLNLDLNEHKKPVMKSLSARVRITGVSNVDKALILAKKAASSGFILNSVKTDCHFEYEIES